MNDYMENILKSLDKTKLVQVKVQVHTKNGVHERLQWKKPSDVKDSDVVVSHNKNDEVPHSKQELIAALQSGKSKEDIMKTAEAAGITWKKSDHAGINWMRASMAIQKSGENSKPVSQPSNVQQKSSEQPSVENNSGDDFELPKNKESIKELLDKGVSKEAIMNKAKEAGITWKPADNAGINWMRASMAIQKGTTVEKPADNQPKPEKKQEDTKQELKQEKKKVKELEDLVTKLKSPNAQEAEKNADAVKDILYGIDTNTKSDYEKKQFDDVIKSATPEQLRNYRTLGMCAGDAESAEYLADLYSKYSSQMTDNTGDVSNSDVDKDPLRNRIQGVVNKMVAGVVKSSLRNVRKRMGQFKEQNMLLDNWCNPNTPLTDEQKDELKSVQSTYLGSTRQNMMTETNGKHEMMHRVLDKLKKHSDYKDEAEEYDKLITEFDDLTKGDKELQYVISGVGDRASKRNTARDDYTKEFTDNCNRHIVDSKEKIQRLKDNYPKRSDYSSDENFNKAKQRSDKVIEEQSKNIDKLNNYLKNADQIGKDLGKAAHIREQLFSDKFTDLNANLYHHMSMGKQLAFQYIINKDFVEEYPVLSHDNLDKLDKADVDTLTNLSLVAGTFKPSLSKDGKDAKAEISKKYSERQALLETYGGVKATGANEYSENNEIRCKVSKAPKDVVKRITDKIAKDWDMQTHGSMKYTIEGIYEVSGLEAEEDFNALRKKNRGSRNYTSGGKNCESDLFYHGTGSMATSLILGHSGQFKVGKAKVGRMLGDGIYLADKSSKSAQYISDNGYARHGISGSLMVCEATLGRTCTARRGHSSEWKNNDSVYGGIAEYGLRNNEWCVHDPKAVIPRYLVKMTIK